MTHKIALSSQPQATGETRRLLWCLCCHQQRQSLQRQQRPVSDLHRPAESRSGKVPTSGLNSQGGACNTDGGDGYGDVPSHLAG